MARTTDVFVCQQRYCGHSIMPEVDEPLPKRCPACKHETAWRLCLPGELSKFDRMFLRRKFIAPDVPVEEDEDEEC